MKLINYNQGGELGQQLVNVQNEHFKNEGVCIQFSMGQLKILMESLNNVSHVENNENIAMDSNTQLNDLIEAKFVKKKCRHRCCF